MCAAMPAVMSVPQFLGAGRIEFTERQVPAAGPGQLLLRVTANAMCGTDRLQLEKGSRGTPGHEVAGSVAAAGPGTTTPAGTDGVVFLMDFCGSCRCCAVGATNQCRDKRGDLGFTIDGGYAPFVVVSESAFFPTAEVTGADATLLLDVLGTGGHALARAQLVRPDVEAVLVTGAGPIGLAVLAVCRLQLGENVPIAVSDLSPARLELVRTLGGVAVDVTDRSLAQGLAEVSFPRPDLAFDAAGRSETRVAALDALDRRGVLVCVGHGQTLTIDVSRQLIATERAVLGSEYFRYDQLPASLALLRQHRDYLSQIITHRLPLDRLSEAFELFLSGRTGKVVIGPDPRL